MLSKENECRSSRCCVNREFVQRGTKMKRVSLGAASRATWAPERLLLGHQVAGLNLEETDNKMNSHHLWPMSSQMPGCSHVRAPAAPSSLDHLVPFRHLLPSLATSAWKVCVILQHWSQERVTFKEKVALPKIKSLEQLSSLLKKIVKKIPKAECDRRGGGGKTTLFL